MNAITAQGHLIAAAKADLAWLERRHARWEAECRPQRNPRASVRSARWLRYSERDLTQARFRLERYLEVDVRDPEMAQR